ncbi:MAG: THUMP domain-containing protein [Gemmataceae bacterium]
MATFFATCARGLEPLLADELRALAATDVNEGRGGVHFCGDLATLYRANLWLRTAVRVLRPVRTFPVQSPEELYERVQEIDWSRYLTLEHTIAVDCNVRDSALTHSHYAALKVKDAICDQFVAKTGKRPSVDTENPLLALNLHVYRNEAVLSFDSSGESLHKRGYRTAALVKAPLNEALAAALVLKTGWRGESTLFDPMCGSGTICVEAAWIALNRPPGLTRKRFAFQSWLDHDVKVWTGIRDEARRGVKKALDHPILGSDSRRDSLRHSQENARAAGVGHLLRFELRDVAQLQPPAGDPGIVICNPPYGERIGEEKELREVYRTLGAVCRDRFAGWRVFVFTGNPRLAGYIGMAPVEQTPFWNGKIACRLLEYRPS